MPVTVSVQNFGPIREAEIELKPLMVLVGTNNTGKTYFATVIHRALDAMSTSSIGRALGASDLLDLREDLARASSGSGDRVADGATTDERLLAWASRTLRLQIESFAEELHSGVEHAFGVPSRELVRRTPSGSKAPRRSQITVSESDPHWSVTVDVATGDVDASPPDARDWLSQIVRSSSLGPRSTPSDVADALLSLITERLHPRARRRGGHLGLLGDWASDSFHLPADRTGIVQSYQILASSVVQQRVEAGIRRMGVPTLPGTVADFLSLLLALTQRRAEWGGADRSAIRKIVAQFEREIGVGVDVDDAGGALPGIVAETPEGRFPLAQTSSMVAELAPILLTAKHILEPKNCLVVDEPEAHLHPGLQKLTARFFRELVDQGVRTLLTTHSDTLLGELNNLIRAHAVSAPLPAHSEVGLGKPIDPADVAALRFDRTSSACVATALPVDPVDGIDESTFGDVVEDLYNETIALIDALNDPV